MLRMMKAQGISNHKSVMLSKLAKNKESHKLFLVEGV